MAKLPPRLPLFALLLCALFLLPPALVRTEGPAKRSPSAPAAQTPPALLENGVTGKDPAEEKVRQKLETLLVPVDFKDMELAKALEEMRLLIKLPMEVNWGALTLSGVEKDAKVSLRSTGLPAAKVLELMLAQVSAPNREDALKFVIDGGLIRVSSVLDLTNLTCTRIYEVGDLLMEWPKFCFSRGLKTGAELVAPPDEMRHGSSGLIGHGNTDDHGPPEANTSSIRGILRILEGIEPTTWRPGGNTGSIYVSGTKLIVTQSRLVHRQIESLLQTLRQARGKMLTLRVTWLRKVTDKPSLYGDGNVPGVTPESLKDAAVAYQAQVTLPSGARGFACAGNVQVIVPTIEPVVGDSTCAARPMATPVLWGAAADAKLALLPGTDQVELKIWSILAEPKEMLHKSMPAGMFWGPPPAPATQPARSDEREPAPPDEQAPAPPKEPQQPNATPAPAPAPPAGKPGSETTVQLDLPTCSIHNFASTQIIPLGKSVVVGMTSAPRKEGGVENVYVVVEVTAQAQRP